MLQRTAKDPGSPTSIHKREYDIDLCFWRDTFLCINLR